MLLMCRMNQELLKRGQIVLNTFSWKFRDGKGSIQTEVAVMLQGRFTFGEPEANNFRGIFFAAANR